MLYPGGFDEFDDALEAADDVDTALEVGEVDVRALARENAPGEFCAACVESTPLAFEAASDYPVIRAFDRSAGAVVARVAEFGEHDHAEWVRSDLADVFIDAYFEACAPAHECDVCTHPDSYGSCGHERLGDPCPAREQGDAE